MEKNLRFLIALWISKAAMFLQKLLGMNASYFPGKLAIKLCPDFLGRIDKPETIITVTGTNGKTTCCNMLLDILTENGYDVLNNKAGSNIDAGIASALIAEASLTGRVSKKLGLFEVDERSSKKIYAYVHPNYTVCTNLFRDSIQRNAHPEFIFSFIDSSLPDDTHLILNADDPISSRLREGNKRSYFSIGRLPTDRDKCINIINDMRMCPKCHSGLEYEYVRYHHIGKMRCPVCGFASPEPDFLASPDWEKGSFTVRTADGEEEYPLVSSSVFNTYNQVTVVAMLRTFGLSAEAIAKSFSHLKIVETRFTSVEKNGVEVITNMTKGQNPVACSIVFDYIRNEPGRKEVILMLDDMTYKKTTEIMTWVFDADFELLNHESITRVVAAGVRIHDYHLRLLLAGIPEDKIRCVENEADAPKELALERGEKVFILHDLTTPVMTKRVRDGILEELDEREAEA
ncbi:MAG: MurT ligase domain-containing protein [Oscillospiraceae bacterium]|nr:MurT ligase domain-containing protein [Oscillospiraceae bacterium]